MTSVPCFLLGYLLGLMTGSDGQRSPKSTTELPHQPMCLFGSSAFRHFLVSLKTRSGQRILEKYCVFHPISKGTLLNRYFRNRVTKIHSEELGIESLLELELTVDFSLEEVIICA